jgi:hypothetical protein
MVEAGIEPIRLITSERWRDTILRSLTTDGLGNIHRKLDHFAESKIHLEAQDF